MRDVQALPARRTPEEASAASPESESTPSQGWTGLLAWAYLRAGLPFPRLEQLRPGSVPKPYRGLLVHSEDMTPTLERFYGEPVGLRVLNCDLDGDSCRREVVLTIRSGTQPILYGAIHIHLARLPRNARRAVELELFPLGHILKTEAVPHLSWPQAFFRIQADAHLLSKFRSHRAGSLFGRRNVLLDGTRRLLAEVMEVLAPVGEPGQASNEPGMEQD